MKPQRCFLSVSRRIRSIGSFFRDIIWSCDYFDSRSHFFLKKSLIQYMRVEHDRLPHYHKEFSFSLYLDKYSWSSWNKVEFFLTLVYPWKLPAILSLGLLYMVDRPTASNLQPPHLTFITYLQLCHEYLLTPQSSSISNRISRSTRFCSHLLRSVSRKKIKVSWRCQRISSEDA